MPCSVRTAPASRRSSRSWRACMQPDEGEIRVEGGPVRFAIRPGGPCGRHRHRLSGTAAVPRTDGRREHFSRPGAADKMGLARLGRDAPTRAPAARCPRQPRARHRREGRHALGRQPPARRDCPRAVAECPGRHHGRADRRACRSRCQPPHGDRTRLQRARRRHRLCQPPPAGGVRARRPRHGAARRRHRRHRGHWRGRREIDWLP